MIGSFADSPDYPRVPARVLERERQYNIRGLAHLLRVPILPLRKRMNGSVNVTRTRGIANLLRLLRLLIRASRLIESYSINDRTKRL